MLLNMVMAAHQGRLRWGRRPTPNGQVLFDTPGTFQWTCPEGVTKVCIAMVGHGGTANRDPSYVGGGANIRYINDIDVVPGQVYGIVVARPHPHFAGNANNNCGALGYSCTSPLKGVVQGWNGGESRVSIAQNANRFGNSAGNLGTHGHGIDLRTFNTVPPNSATFSGGNYGAGAGVSNQWRMTGAAGRSALRIIWGEDRTFPDKNIGDL